MTKTLPRICLAVWTACLVAAAPPSAIKFQNSLDDARKLGQPPRPVVILFGAPWCGWCRKLASETLTDPKVQAIADQFAWVKIDIDKNPELAARFDVEGVPATVVIDPQGRVLGARDGYLPAEPFLEFLTGSVRNPRPQELLPDLVERLAKAKNTSDRHEAMGHLVEQLARPDRRQREEILSALERQGAAAWPLCLKWMTDRRLAVRAAAGGALRHASKGSLPFQPFAAESVRQKQVAEWQKWLAAHGPTAAKPPGSAG